MKIAFATTQSLAGSTMIGRVLPLARHFAPHQVLVLVLLAAKNHSRQAGENILAPGKTLLFRAVGREPFRRIAGGKQRLNGLSLVVNMLATALRTAWQLWRFNPDCAVIVKTLPHNVLGAYIYKKLFRGHARIIADVDDFELAANTISSLNQRAAIHWAERAAVSLSDAIVTATPFLTDHFMQLVSARKVPVLEIPTGIDPLPAALSSKTSAGSSASLLYLGSLSIASGHRVDLLPDILASVRLRIPEARLIIAGSGDDEQALHQKFDRLHLSSAVIWKSQFTPQDVPDLLARGHILVDPIDSSIVARAKSSSRTLLAGALGFPVVTSNIGIRPYFLPDALHKRFFAAPGDAEQYADKIVALLGQPLTEADRRAMRQRVQPYLWLNLARRYLKIITIV